MATFAHRVLGAARLEPAIYEEVEADRTATGQAAAIVVLASVAAGIGSLGLNVQSAGGVIAATIGGFVGWLAWAVLTYVIGTRWLPGAQTRSTVGELLRTLGFAAAPGLLRILGVLPFLGAALYALASVWMLVAMVVAVRQALDYSSTGRALAVCVAGWVLSLVIAAVIANVFATDVF
jgi:hypothetical protein